jgi:protein O-mannosyl-transferase
MHATHNNIPPGNRRSLFWLQAAIFILPVLIYSNTIGHDYALDDAMVITQNDYTKMGFSGLKELFTEDSFAGFYRDKKVDLPGGRYRPLSIATFAIEYAFFGLNPHLSHLFNILLYAFTGMILYSALRLLFKYKNGSPVLLSVPVIATFIFLAHPIHTEAVANIKGRDEILSLLFSLLALISAVKYVDKRQWPWLLMSFAFLFLGLLSKENAITFVVMLPLAVFFFREVPFRKLVIVSAPPIAASILYLLIRNAITGGFQVSAAHELMNNPFIYATLNQKYATIVLTLGIYLKLLFWPHPLTFDYYPFHIELTGWQNIGVIATLAVYFTLIFYAITTIRGKKTAAFSILFFVISLLPVSNLFINMGTFMNERFIYQASVAYATGLSGFILSVLDMQVFQKLLKKQTVKAMIFSVLILSYSALTFVRNFAWKNDFTLFLTDVKTSSNSAKSNCAAGGVLLDRAIAASEEDTRKEYLEQSIRYLTKATAIDPTYSDVWRKLGRASFELNHDVPASFRYYYTAISINPGDEMAYSNIHFILSGYDSIDRKIRLYEELLRIDPKRSDIYGQLGLLYGRGKKDYPASIACFKEAVRLNPAYKEAYKGLGVAFQMTGDYTESLHWLEVALRLDTLDAGTYKLMGNSMLKSGNREKAELLFSRADQLKKNSRPN